jgi:hypothetical protein
MAKRWRSSPVVTIVGVALGSLLIGVILNLPTEICVSKQEQVLLAGPYKYVPERAGDSARIMCERSASLREKYVSSSLPKF